MKRLSAREAFSPTRAWTVDRQGRWRDGKGRFVPRTRLLERVGDPVGTQSIARMLRDAARQVPKGGPTEDYLVMVDFEGYGWRTLAHAEGLRGALKQSAFEVTDLPERLQGYWRARDGGPWRKEMRPGERVEPRIRGIQVKRLKDEPRKKRKRKRK